MLIIKKITNGFHFPPDDKITQKNIPQIFCYPILIFKYGFYISLQVSHSANDQSEHFETLKNLWSQSVFHLKAFLSISNIYLFFRLFLFCQASIAFDPWQKRKVKKVLGAFILIGSQMSRIPNYFKTLLDKKFDCNTTMRCFKNSNTTFLQTLTTNF